MNWKQAAIQDLQKYDAMCISLPNIKMRITSLRDRMTSIKSASVDVAPVMGGGNRYEDNVLNCLVEIERLKLTYRAEQKLINVINNGLSALDSRERAVLQRFYINRPNNHIFLLCEELNCEQAQIYRLKDIALYKFTVAEYGLTEY